MKVLWLSNIGFNLSPIQSSGTWLISMGNALISTGKVELYNICPTSNKNKYYKNENINKISQWNVPIEKLDKCGLPSKKTIKYIQDIVDELNPDIIHIWGVENYWGLLSSRKLIKGNVLLEIQGLKYACAKVFFGGLIFKEKIKCIGIKEILYPNKSIFASKNRFEKWSKFEFEIIKYHCNISTQSDWIRAHVISMNPDCKIYETGIILREEFTKSESWKRTKDNPVLFTTISGAFAYKGLHVLLRAVSILKLYYPNIKLKIAGSQINGRRTSGYFKFLISEAKRKNILDSIEWLGCLDAKEIVHHLQISSVAVIPSFVESYSLSLAEAMVLGVPCVVAFSGAMPELATDNKSALFYSAMDEIMCASQIRRIIENKELATKISINAKETGISRNNPLNVVNKQIEIYNSLFRS